MKILRELSVILAVAFAVATVLPWFWACIIPVNLFTIGIVYTATKPFYDFRKRPFIVRLRRFAQWMLNILYQCWVVIKKLLFYIGLVIDLFGNVLVGELIEDVVTAEEDTLFGKGDATVSQALGDLQKRGKLNKAGKIFCSILDALDDRHCAKAIARYEFNQNLKKHDK